MRSNTLLQILGLTSIVLLSGAAADAAVYYVALGGSGANGQSWATAYRSISAAIQAAEAGDEIWVKQGTYGTDSTFYVNKAVKIYGGYSGVGDTRNSEAFKTTIDGQHTASHCFYVSANATIDGFTIIKGRAYGVEPSDRGAGMYVYHCRPTISHCVFERNYADFVGGAIALDNATGTVISDCSFLQNRSSELGGAIYSRLSDITVENCRFEENVTGIGPNSSYGGAIHNDTCAPTIFNCTFSNNSADYGAGLCNYMSNAHIERCTFADCNATTLAGGGIYNRGGAATISECLFQGNRAHRGGAIFDKSLSTIVNCIMWNNTGMTNGGAIYIDTPAVGTPSAATFINCTMYGNRASQGGALYSDNASPTLVNCILWGNVNWDEESPGDIYNMAWVSNQKAVASYCDIGGDTTYPGTGNLRVDPKFVNAPGGDFWLQGSSPCIDHGTNSVPGLPSTDYAGEARVSDGNGDGLGVADMGAFEIQGYTPTNPLLSGEILQGMVYENPADTAADYTFMIKLQTLGTIDHIDFRTPAGNTFTIPNAEHTSSGNVETYHVEWPSPINHIWTYLARFNSAAGLNSYGDGTYTITYYYRNGGSLITQVAYNLAGSTPVPQPSQKPNITSPAYGASVGGPVTLSWDACTDSSVNAIFATVIDTGTGHHVAADTFAKSATTSNSYSLENGVYDVEFSFAHLLDTADNAGTPFEIGKDIMVGHQFEVANAYATVYRFWSPVNSVHFYTITPNERDMLISDFPHVWTFEGMAYHTFGEPSEAGLMPVYRFWSGHSHFYTINEGEKDMLIRDFPGVWAFEGIAFYAFPEGQQPAGTKPIYRFWNGASVCHFYTISESERDMIQRDFSYVWAFEGIAYYAYE